MGFILSVLDSAFILSQGRKFVQCLSRLPSKEKSYVVRLFSEAPVAVWPEQVVSGGSGLLQRPPADDPGGAGLVAKIQYGGIRFLRKSDPGKRYFLEMIFSVLMTDGNTAVAVQNGYFA